jgi:hypothetical protein
MELIQSRRRFLASLSAAGAAGLLRPRRALADEAPPEVTTIRLSFTPGICFVPLELAGAFLRAEGFHGCSIRESDRRLQRTTDDRAGRGGLRLQLCRHRGLPSGCGTADHRGQWPACRLLRAVRARTGPRHRRSEGPPRGHPDAQLERAPLRLDHGQARRPRPEGGHRVGRAAVRSCHRAVRRRQDGRVSRLSA